MSLAALARQMHDAGTPIEGIILALEAVEARDNVMAAQRAKEAERTRRYRERGGGQIPETMRQEVFARDGFACVDCSAVDHLQCDHIHPVSKGGPTTLDNLQTLCRPCNARKKDRIRKRDVRGHSEDTSGDIPAAPAPLVSPLPLSPDPLPQPPYNPPTPANPVRAKSSGFGEPEGVEADSWKAFCGQRKKRLTQIAYDRILKTLEDGRRAGWPPGEMIELAIERGWETVFVPKEQRNGRSANGLGGNRGQSVSGHGVTMDAATNWLNRRMGAALG